MESEHTIDLFALTLPYAPKMVELVPPTPWRTAVLPLLMPLRLMVLA
jgi:hypothetical protein